MVQVYIIGGDGTQKGASVIFEVTYQFTSLYYTSNGNSIHHLLLLVLFSISSPIRIYTSRWSLWEDGWFLFELTKRKDKIQHGQNRHSKFRGYIWSWNLCILQVWGLTICIHKSLKKQASFVQEIRRRGLKVAVAGIPKTIDNDIPVFIIHNLPSYFHKKYLKLFLSKRIPCTSENKALSLDILPVFRLLTSPLALILPLRRLNVPLMQPMLRQKVLKMGLVLWRLWVVIVVSFVLCFSLYMLKNLGLSRWSVISAFCSKHLVYFMSSIVLLWNCSILYI